MSTAACAPLSPAAGWGDRTRGERRLRSGAVLAVAVALHVGATVLFARASAPGQGAATPGAAKPVAMVWLVPERRAAMVEAPVAAAINKRGLATPRVASAVAVRKTEPVVAVEPPVPIEPRAEPLHDSAGAELPAPRYQLARRSIVFGGSTAPRDDAQAPANTRRSLDGWVQDGIARSVWPLASLLAGSSDGSCRASRERPAFTCSTSSLDARMADAAPDAQRALLSWLRSGLANEIEIRVEAGIATYVVQ